MVKKVSKVSDTAGHQGLSEPNFMVTKYTNSKRLWVGPIFLAQQTEKFNVLPCVRNLLSYTSYLKGGPQLVT